MLLPLDSSSLVEVEMVVLLVVVEVVVVVT